MAKRQWYIGMVVLMALVLSSCGQINTPTTLSTGDAARVYGGGDVLPLGQFTEGLVVVGTGTASADPEIVWVTFGVDLRGDDPAALVDEAATKVDGAIAAAKELGIADADIQTVGYNLWVETVTDPQTVTSTDKVAYHVSHFIQVTLRDLGQVGELLAAVIEAGANTISGVNFTVENPDALAEEARQEALKDARAKAEQIAERLDTVIERPVLVEEIGGGYAAPAARGTGAAYEVAAPPVSPGVFSVSVSVQVVYKLP
jgi:uncharacterized protein YggE